MVPRMSRSARTSSPASSRSAIATTCRSPAVDEEVGRCVREDRGADRIRPVVVVGEPPERGLDPAEHDRRPGKGRVDPVGVDEHGAIGPARNAAGRVRVLCPAPPVRGIPVHHRVDRPRGDRDEEARTAEGEEVLPARAGLGADPDQYIRRPRARGRSRPCRRTDGPRRRPPRRGARRSRRARGGRARAGSSGGTRAGLVLSCAPVIRCSINRHIRCGGHYSPSGERP